LADRGELESEYVIDEDLAIVVGFGEPVGAGIELFVIFRRLKTKRVELGVKVAEDPVRADQHEGAYRVPGGLLHVGRRDLDAFALRFSLDLVADRLLDLGPVAVERGHEFAARRPRPVWPLPGGTLRALANVDGVVLQAREEFLPGAVDGLRVLLIACVK